MNAVNTAISSSLQLNLNGDFKFGSFSEINRDLIVNTAFLRVFGKINGGMVLGESASKAGVIRNLRGLYNNGKLNIGGARIDIARNGNYLFSRSAQMEKISSNILTSGKPLVSLSGGLLKNYSKSFQTYE